MRWSDVAEHVAPFAAEFLGTFFVVLTVGCNTITGSKTWMPTSISFAIMVAMYATAPASGGHLNPALSFAFGLTRKMKWHAVWGYMAVQFLAGLLAAAAATGLLNQGVNVGPKEGFDWLDSMVVELVYSSMFCFVALNCMASLRNNPKWDRNQFFALAVGFVGIAGGHTTGKISGAFFNPACTLGFGLTTGSAGHRLWTLIYAGYQFSGSVVACTLFFMVRPEELAALGIFGEGLSCKRAFGALSLCGSRPSEHLEDQGREAAVEVAEAGETHTKRQLQQQDNYRAPYPARVLAEFVGTYVVVFTFGLSTVMASSEAPGAKLNATLTEDSAAEGLLAFSGLPGADSHPLKLLESRGASTNVAWATGAAVLCMSYSLANISGGHFNPAVTLAVMCTGKCGGPGHRVFGAMESLSFMVVQAAASILAALTYVCVHRGKGDFKEVVVFGPKHDYGWSAVAIGEAIFTLAVALCVLCTTTVRDPRYPKAPSTRSFQFAFAIGMCVTAGGFALEGITGGNLNPAVSLGVSTANFIGSGLVVGDRTSRFLSYAIPQMSGGLMAAAAFRLAHPLEYKEDPLLQ